MEKYKSYSCVFAVVICVCYTIISINGSGDEAIVLCGEIEVQKPAILGRVVNITYLSNSQGDPHSLEWYRRKNGSTWNRLPLNTKFKQTKDGNIYTLTLNSTVLEDSDLQYKAVLNTTLVHCESPIKVLQLEDLNGGCGLVYLRNPTLLSAIQDGDHVEVGYYPAPAVVANETKEYIRDWRRFSENCPSNVCQITSETGRFEEKLVPNHEYVLTIIKLSKSFWGSYSVRCTQNRPSGDKYTNNVTLFIPVPPTSPTFANLTDFEDCKNCLVGVAEEQYSVLCKTTGGSVPVNVTITVGNETQQVLKDPENGGYRAFFYLWKKYHDTFIVCNVTNVALTTPLTTSALVYVIDPPSIKVFSVPDRIKEGDKKSITCVYTESRPPARVSVRLDRENGSTISAAMPGTNTTAIVKTFDKLWNGRKLYCCVYVIRTQFNNCSQSATVKYLFPPDSVSLTVDNNFDGKQHIYTLKANCTIYGANPPCEAVWEVPIGVNITKGVTHSANGGLTKVFSASITVNKSHTGEKVVCEANCSEFRVAMKDIIVINSPGTSENNSPRPHVFVLATAGVTLIAVVSLAAVIVIRKKQKTTKEPGARNEVSRSDGEYSLAGPIQDSTVAQEDVTYAQVNKQAKFKTASLEKAEACQLLYAELDLQPPDSDSSAKIVKRRDSPTEYISIDFNKTSLLANPDTPAENVYAT